MIAKKAVTVTLSFLVGIVITVVGLLFLFSFTATQLDGLSEVIASSADEAFCRQLIQTRTDLSIGGFDVPEAAAEGMLDFVFRINKGCVKEVILIDSTDKEEIFETIADRSQSCWFRYGEGKEDFLNDFGTTGNWCFTCAKISFDNDIGTFEYTDYISWVFENVEENEALSFLDVQFSNFKDEKVYNDLDIIEEQQRLILEGKEISDEEEAAKIYHLLQRDYVALTDVLQKRIDTSENNYIVLRYDRPIDDWDETLIESVTSIGDRSLSFLGSFGQQNPFVASFNNDYVQYVDLMTQEQYFKSCGIEPSFGQKES